MDMNLILHECYPKLFAGDRSRLADFLSKFDLRYEEDIEYACCYVDENERLQACGCCAGNILKCFAISGELRGQNVMGSLITQLQKNRFQEGYSHLFVYTKPKNQAMFEGSGFYLLAATDTVAMLENKASGVSRFLEPLRENADGKRVGSIVVNCNPFTLGHQYLIEYAAERCELLYVFVVEEDRSVFPFDRRIELVKGGSAHLVNVHVHPSGPYMISAATFPTYFLKQNIDATQVQAELDVTVFARKIAPELHIQTRFVGEEPFCAATNSYNAVMKRILPENRIDVVEIPRKAKTDGTFISATEVRARLAAEGPGLWLQEYVPAVTFDYLMSEEAVPVLNMLSKWI